MPVTRSATKKQSKLEDFAQSDSEGSKSAQTNQHTSKDQSAANKSSKRKDDRTQTTKVNQAHKKQKQQHVPSDNIDELESPIVINRAPVLQLWGAVVAQFLHSQLTWPACLSIGNAISSLCAISKGRAIGMVEPKDSDGSNDQKERKEVAEDNTQEIHVMGFPLHLQRDAVLISGKPKPFSEKSLEDKFGREHYEAAKNAMVESLKTWTNDKDEFEKRAFHMYEEFRPNIAKGQQGWGRKGKLNLQEVANIIKRSSD